MAKKTATPKDEIDEDLTNEEEEGDSDFFDPSEEEATSTKEPALSPEPLFSTLLYRAVMKTSPNDTVLLDYTRLVAPPLSRRLAHKTAKGGDFVVERLAKGASKADTARYTYDQSMRGHLLNGIFPVALVARTLREWGVERFRNTFDDACYRLFCAGYTLHDWLKLPGVEEQLDELGLKHNTVNPATHRQQVRQIVAKWCKDLALDQFLAPLGSIESLLDDLILIASNTQVKWGTMRYLAALPDLSPQWQHEVTLATQLCTLADYLAYVGKTPIEAAKHTSIGKEIQDLSNHTARLTYHHIANLRGVLTNIINNAAVDAYAISGQRVPILYAPSGVVYLERTSAAQDAPDLAQVADAIARRIQAVCRDRLSANLIGFSRDGKGLKYAPFYELFFTPRQLPAVIAKAAHVRTAGSKTSAAGTRYAKMVEKGMVPTSGSVDGLPTQDTSVDMLAEGIAKIEQVMRDASPELDAQQWLTEKLGISDIAEQMREIPTLANMGGVPYPWYYAAGVLYRRTPGLDREEWRERLEELARQAGTMLPDEIAAGGWGELRTYVLANLRFEHTAGEPANVQQMAAQELQRYSGARRIRGATQVCSLCSSSFSVSEQRESGILFAPMVYTNKQPLHGNKAIRSICAICEMEMMLRQVLMNNSAAVGKKFEGRRMRYLFFYPTYFFTPETLLVLQDIYTQMQRMRFTALRKLLLPDGSERSPTANLEPATYQRLEDLLLDPTLPSRPDEDRLFRMRFSEGEPVSFGIVGIPPASRKAKDAEAWVHPAFLALVLPLLIDIKVVASESMLPLFNEANELPETVAFDGPHQFINYIIGQNRLNLDQLWRALQRLTAAYLIHLEGNARSGSGGYDYHWNDIPALARNLSSSPLYAFHYIKKGMRQEGGEAINTYKATLYNDLVGRYFPEGEKAMSHARELTTRYRRFYRHKKLNSNGVLRPISEASKALLSADLRLFNDDESLIEIVRGRLEQFVERVEKKHADGAVPVWLYTNGDRSPREALQLAVDDFSHYFVETIYRDVFQGDRAALAGKQLNLLKNACESIYMAEQRREWSERGQTPEEKLDESDLDESENG